LRSRSRATDPGLERRRRRRGLPAAIPAAGPAELAEARQGSRLRWYPWPFDVPQAETLFLHVDDAEDGIEFTACGDPAQVSAAELEGCVRYLEEILVAAAVNPAGRVGLRVPTGTG
jgi:hypothetical protein